MSLNHSFTRPESPTQASFIYAMSIYNNTYVMFTEWRLLEMELEMVLMLAKLALIVLSSF
jgi:hypothetical protein